MTFGMVSGVGRSGMAVLDGVVIVEGEGAVLGLNLGRPIATNGNFATRLFPNYFGQYLLLSAVRVVHNVDPYFVSRPMVNIFDCVIDLQVTSTPCTAAAYRGLFFR